MPTRSRILLPALAVAGALVLAGCSAPASTTSSTSDQSLTVSTPTEPDSLDPTFANTFAANLVFTSFCEKLYDVDKNLNIVPELAAALPTVAKDGLSMTIPVKPGVKFNDGTPLDAAAIVTTLERDMTEKGSARISDLSDVKDVTAPDDMTVKIDLKQPSSALTAQLASRAGAIMSPTQLKKLGDKFGDDPVCVGPFSYKSRVNGTSMTFTKSPYYYDKSAVKLSSLTYKFITESSVATQNLQSGDLQAAEHLDPSDAVTLEKTPGFTALKSDTISFQQISINISPKIGTPLSKSADLRKAFAMAIDRDQINKAVWSGQQKVDCGPLPLQSPLHSDTPCVPYDPAGAKKLVQAAGYSGPIPVQLTVPTGASGEREAQVIQSMEEKVGFKVTVKPVDLVSALVQARAGKLDVFLEGWSGRVDPDGDLNDLVTTGGSNNFTGSNDATTDKLVAEASSTYDQSTRKALYAQIVQHLSDVGANIYLYHSTWFTGTASNVHGIAYYPDGIPRFKTAYISGK